MMKAPLHREIGWAGVLAVLLGSAGCLGPQNAGPLHEALWQKDSISKLKTALDAGADVNRRDERGRTPLYVAVLGGNLSAAEMLVAHGAKLGAGERWLGHQTALHAAAEKGYTDIVEFLIDAGTNPNVQDDFGVTPLHLAAWMTHPDAVRTLLLHGTKPAIRCKGQRTPLNGIGVYSQGVGDDYTKVVELLLEAGLDANTAEDDGTTPLLDACTAKATSVVALLLRKGVNVNAKSSTGFTALMIASDVGSPQLVETLIQAGADIGMRNSEGQSALDVAVSGRHEEVITLLRAAGLHRMPDVSGQ